MIRFAVRTFKERTAKCEIKNNHLEKINNKLVATQEVHQFANLQVALPTDIQREIKGYSLQSGACKMFPGLTI